MVVGFVNDVEVSSGKAVVVEKNGSGYVIDSMVVLSVGLTVVVIVDVVVVVVVVAVAVVVVVEVNVVVVVVVVAVVAVVIVEGEVPFVDVDGDDSVAVIVVDDDVVVPVVDSAPEATGPPRPPIPASRLDIPIVVVPVGSGLVVVVVVNVVVLVVGSGRMESSGMFKPDNSSSEMNYDNGALRNSWMPMLTYQCQLEHPHFGLDQFHLLDP